MADGENTQAQAEKAPEPAAPAPKAVAAPPTQAEAKPEEAPAPERATTDVPVPPKEEEKRPVVGNVLLFGRWDVSAVTLRDAGIARYVDISAVVVPHSGGKHSTKQFGKAKMSIVERLINGMMRTENFTGKKIKAYRAVDLSFGIVDKKTQKNPLQVFVDAIQNVAPREEVTRLQYGGISVPKAVDVAPARRVDLALRYICQGALDASHKSKKPIEECLADEIISAARADVNCFSVAKKEEIERVASSAR
jgi:small subunit ribosomal protein S7